MGSHEDEQGRTAQEIQHKVTLSKAFYIGVFEVTQQQWKLVMGSNPSKFKKNSDLSPVEQVGYVDIRGSGDGANWPATNSVDATSFMGKLRSRTGKVFDLPTEAQWEYACRAGTTGAYFGKGDLGDMAWYKDNTSGNAQSVGQKKANAWGLYDMHGNVWEWCLDWYGPYPGTVTDPLGAAAGSNRVIRGGGWNNDADSCRLACRGFHVPYYRHTNGGFRAGSTLP
jgi:formylglycine-generating enzyme required for sulfatase activity